MGWKDSVQAMFTSRRMSTWDALSWPRIGPNVILTASFKKERMRENGKKQPTQQKRTRVQGNLLIEQVDAPFRMQRAFIRTMHLVNSCQTLYRSVKRRVRKKRKETTAQKPVLYRGDPASRTALHHYKNFQLYPLRALMGSRRKKGKGKTEGRKEKGRKRLFVAFPFFGFLQRNTLFQL